MPDSDLKQPIALPRRFILGAFVTAGVVATASVLGFVGYGKAPSSEEFQFTRGTSFASGEEARLKGYFASYAAQNDIGFRIVGHSGTTGASAANLALSEERAAIAETIAEEQAIPASRILSSNGVGGGNPLARASDESEREYQSRLSRVTVTTIRLPQ